MTRGSGSRIRRALGRCGPRALGALAAAALCAAAALARQGQGTPPRNPYLWVSPHQLRALPDSGPEWDKVLADADRDYAPDILDKDDKTDTYVVAGAMVAWRTGIGSYRARVRAACMEVTLVPPPPANDINDASVAWSRNLTGYVVAAGLVGLTPLQDRIFRDWLAGTLPLMRRIHRERPNNIGLHAGAARAAIAIYLGDLAEAAAAWDVFRRWLGDDTSPFNYRLSDWGGSDCAWGWQGEPYPLFFGINRPGTSALSCTEPHRALGVPPLPLVPRDVAGAMPDDQRRADRAPCGCDAPAEACCITWPPAKTNYVYEALQGVLAQAVLHHRRGRDPWSIAPDPNSGHGAILRAFEWLRDVAAHPIDDPVNGKDDYWETYLVNQVYAGLPGFVPFAELPGGVAGKSLAYTDWTTLDSSWP